MRNFKWLSADKKLSVIKIGNGIEYIIINLKKIKLLLEDDTSNYTLHQLNFPFTYNDFITYAGNLVSSLSEKISWLKKLQYMKDYILAPLQVSSKNIIIGIIILDDTILKPLLKPADILESNNYLARINLNKSGTNEMEWEINMLDSILAKVENKISPQMKLYLINCRSYIPLVIIQKMPKIGNPTNFFHMTSSTEQVA
jgi:hypothetical protein